MFAGEGAVYRGSPPIATEWNIEARGGGLCAIHVVHSLFASTDEWDNQLEGAKSGWAGSLNILRTYLAHVRGQPSAITHGKHTKNPTEHVRQSCRSRAQAFNSRGQTP